MRLRKLRRTANYVSYALLFPIGLLIAENNIATPASAAQSSKSSAQTSVVGSYQSTAILSGDSLKLSFSANGSTHSETLTQPDDLTRLGAMIFVAFQNHVGPLGQVSPSGNADSTVVEFTPGGKVIAQWNLSGHTDGLAADPVLHKLIATVNEDGNSSLYTISPSANAGFQVQHYHYGSALPHGGGTDAVSIYHGKIFISASAPTVANGPAVYKTSLDWATHIANVVPVFFDNSTAANANTGSSGTTTLALTDPDSNEIVPGTSPRFAGDFVLDSQGDQQQIYVNKMGTSTQGLAVLDLSTSINDTAWATDEYGTLYATDNANGTIYAITGHFASGTAFVAATPCDANTAPATCPAPGFPANYLGVLNMNTGNITPVALTGTSFEPGGLMFVNRMTS